MQAIHIRGVPDSVVAALKRRAAANHRSMQGEVLHILSEEARKAPPSEPPAPISLRTVASGRTSDYTREAIYGDSTRG